MNVVDMAHAISAARHGIEPPGDRWEVALRLFYGLPLSGAQIALAAEMTGRSPLAIRQLRGHAFFELWCRVGRRGRKSSTAALIAVFELIAGGHERYLMPGETGLIAVCSKDTAGARVVLSFARAYLEALGIEYRDARMGNVSILELPAFRFNLAVLTSTTTAPRGYPIPVFIADEIAHFASDDASANQDRQVLAAARPAQAQFPDAKLIAISTPLAREGLHYDTIEAALGNDSERHVLAVEGPTWAFGNISEQRCRELERDEPTFEREYRAAPMDKRGAQFFDPVALDLAGTLPTLPEGDGEVFAAGADFAFRSDASALVIVRRVRNSFEVVRTDELRPGIFGALKPSKVCREFADIAKRYGVSAIMSDGHYAESIRENLAEQSIALLEAPAGSNGKTDVHVAVRDLVREGRLRIPSNEERLLAQLKAIVGKPAAGGGITIASPRRGGRHGDIASAAVLAVYAATQTSGARLAATAPCTPATYRWAGMPGRGFG